MRTRLRSGDARGGNVLRRRTRQRTAGPEVTCAARDHVGARLIQARAPRPTAAAAPGRDVVPAGGGGGITGRRQLPLRPQPQGVAPPSGAGVDPAAGGRLRPSRESPPTFSPPPPPAPEPVRRPREPQHGGRGAPRGAGMGTRPAGTRRGSGPLPTRPRPRPLPPDNESRMLMRVSRHFRSFSAAILARAGSGQEGPGCIVCREPPPRPRPRTPAPGTEPSAAAAPAPLGRRSP